MSSITPELEVYELAKKPRADDLELADKYAAYRYWYSQIHIRSQPSTQEGEAYLV